MSGIQKLLQSRNRNDCFLTCSGRIDGAGAQAHAQISTIVAAEFLGFRFIYTPFYSIAHNENNVKKVKWIGDWEKFFNLGDGYDTMDFIKTKFSKNFHKRRINFGELLRIPNDKLPNVIRSSCLFTVTKSHEILEKFWDDRHLQDILQNTMLKLQSNYQKFKKPNLVHYKNLEDKLNSKKNILNVAVHIRKGDILNDPTKYIENDYFFNIASQIEKLSRETKFQIRLHIFSEGKLSKDFPELKWIDRKIHKTQFHTIHCNEKWYLTNDIYVHLDGDPKVDLHHLINADILVMSKSCYSYIAGLYNSGGIKLYTTWRYKHLSDWIPLSNDQDNQCFDHNIFKKKMTAFK